MIIIFQRKQIADGIFFGKITDKRFKANRIEVRIINDFDDLPRADYAAASYILSDCCKRFPNYRLMSRQLANMYEASLTSGTSFFQPTNQRMVYLHGTVLDDRYALEGEALVREFCGLIRDCLLDPNANEVAFDETAAALMRGELIDSIDSVINDKSSYAAENAAKTAFAGESLERSALGTHEEAEKVTAQSAYSAYKRLLESGHFEITATGYSDFEDAEKIFAEMAEKLERRDICILKGSPSPLKAKPAYVSDKLEMQQAILRMYLKAPEFEDIFAGALFAMILGGMTTSRFFSNIREKQSLCYYCSGALNRFNRTLIVQAGVEPQNLKRTEEAVMKELSDICSKGVTDEELKTALLEMENRVAAMRESMAMANWYISQISDGKFLSPEEYLDELKKVTVERITETAKQFKLDTVYSLSGEEPQ